MRLSNSNPDLPSLNAFLDENDRDKARFFVGRRTQIDHIERRWRKVRDLADANEILPASNASILVQGAPAPARRPCSTTCKRPGRLTTPHHGPCISSGETLTMTERSRLVSCTQSSYC